MDGEEERRDVGDELVELNADLAGGLGERDEVGVACPERDCAGEVDVDVGIGDAVECGGQIAGVGSF